MPPLKPWMRVVLWITAIVSMVGGLAMALLRRELFDLANLEHPGVPFPIQAAGAVIALLGVGLWSAARRPYENRSLVLISSAANAALVAAMAYNVASEKVPPYLCIVAIVQFVLFVLLGKIAYELYRVSLTVGIPEGEHEIGRKRHDGSNSLESSPSVAGSPLWRRRFVWGPMLIGVFAMAAWSTIPTLHRAQRWWLAPQPLVLTPAAADLPVSASVATDFVTVDAFPNLRFKDPVDIIPMQDGTDRLLVAERRGRIQLFDNAPSVATKTLFLDITDRVLDPNGTGEDGLSGIALHPQFSDLDSPHCGEFFLHYTAMVAGQRSIRVSKFRVPVGREVADRTSEVVLIDQPDENPSHNGGSIRFGPDGFLYVTIGDDDQRHPNPYAQYIDRDLFSGVLRIDVDCQGGNISHKPPRQPDHGTTRGYFIPNDNPFVGQPNALEEFYAIGLRNPWRASFDRKTGDYWVTDVGERLREEINIVENGSNCGWAYVEGSVPTNTHSPEALGRPEQYLGKETWPVHEYERDALNRCIIGGYVYRGHQFPELVGKYIYADVSGRIYALEVDKNEKFVSNTLIAVIEDLGHNAVSFGEDVDGELLMCIIPQLDSDTGQIHRFARTSADPAHKMPTKLSDTGLFTDMRTLTPAPYLVPYEINSPLWSDRAEKHRWIGVPKSTKIHGEWAGAWSFPNGSIFIKHFDLPLDERVGPKRTSRRLETRVLVRDDHDGIYGGTYRWNDTQTEATLVDFPETEVISYIDAAGRTQTQTWYYPGRFECLICHNRQTNRILAFNARQLNRDIKIDSRMVNQLVRFARAGMFASPWNEEQLTSLPRLASLDDSNVSVEHRVRSYLDANCSHCHRPHVYTGLWDGRFAVPLEHQRIVGGDAIFHQITDPLAVVVRPGDAKHSYMWKRMTSNAPTMRMPPLGRNVVDKKAAALIAEWIESLPSVPKTESDIAAKQNAEVTSFR